MTFNPWIFRYFTLFLLSVIISSCQDDRSRLFVVTGYIHGFDGYISLVNSVSPKFYDPNNLRDSIKVDKGHFTVELRKKNGVPLPYRLMSENFITWNFILEELDQEIRIDSLYHNVRPRIIGGDPQLEKEQEELNQRQNKNFEVFRQMAMDISSPDYPKDSVVKHMNLAREYLSNSNDSILIDFINDHPKSYIAFWRLAFSNEMSGYRPAYDYAYNAFSDDLKESKEGKLFTQGLNQSKKLQIGEVFPILKLESKHLSTVLFDVSRGVNADYTLVDFWFSHCAPCIAQFPTLTSIYSSYDRDRIEIIGVSVESDKNVSYWQKMIREKQLNWPQYLDRNGAVTSPMGISSFPTNYLLDKDGIIIEKNISLIDLEKLIKGIEISPKDL